MTEADSEFTEGPIVASQKQEGVVICRCPVRYPDCILFTKSDAGLTIEIFEGGIPTRFESLHDPDFSESVKETHPRFFRMEASPVCSFRIVSTHVGTDNAKFTQLFGNVVHKVALVAPATIPPGWKSARLMDPKDSQGLGVSEYLISIPVCFDFELS